MRLYNKLFGIVTDDSVPDPAPTGYFPDIGALQAGAYALYGAAGYSVDPAADDTSDTLSKSAVLYKWRVDDGVTEVIDQSFSLSPYSVEISDTSPPNWQPDDPYEREGTAYALFYRLRLPVRFNYIGNVGDAISSPRIMVDMDISTSAGDTYTAICQFGQPSIYVDAQNLSYDKYDGMSIGSYNEALSGVIGINFFDIPISGSYGKYTYDIILDFPLYISDWDYPLVMMQGSDYEVDVKIYSITFTDSGFQNVRTNGTILEEIAAEQKQQNEIENERYEQEQQTINQATGTASDGLAAATETLSSWEIFTMPVKVTGDFVTAITSSSSAHLTFPSFSLMGQPLWPSYTFNLDTVAEKFPLLCDSLHLISGILVVLWFLRYLWRKWSLITGDDLPEGEVR